MIVAFDAAASWMSSLVMPPTPRRTNDSFTSSRSSFLRLSVTASSEPVTSALTMRLSVAASPAWIWLKMSSSRAPPPTTAAVPPIAATRCQCSRVSATLRADFSSGATTKSSPASATSDRPSTWTGVDGPASLTCSPLSSMSARTRPHAAPATSGSPTLRRAALHEDGGHGAAADVEVGLEHDAPGPPVGHGPELLELGDDEQVLEQVVDADALERRDLDHDRVAAPRLGDEAALGELGHDPLGVGVLAVDLVDGDDDRHVGGLGVVERLDGLGHHAVVGRDHQHDDVGGVGAAGPHGGERLVARGVDEGDRRGRP